MPKIAFILPAIGKKTGEKYIKTWQLMEPLVISTLKSLTPPDWETVFFDDRIELIDYNCGADLVAITTEVYTALRAYDIADQFRAKGATVILGGYHATLNPQEAAAHGNSVLLGNAEGIWNQVLADWQAGRLQARYQGHCAYASVLPDRSIFAGKKYSVLGVIETGRGCIFHCEFCAITAFHQGHYHRKPVQRIVEEVKDSLKAGKKLFFFADDNIVANTNHAIALFKALTPLKIRWSGQGSLTMARNPELLYWIRKSGCTLMLIGYESLEDANLKQMNKEWARKLGDTAELTKTIHKAGINIYATFVFGYDHDSPETFRRTREFAEKMGFYVAAFNHLLPMPGTPLHQRLAAEDRLEQPTWWLSPGYLYGRLVFRPALMSPEELSQHCRRARLLFYRPTSILRRGLQALIRRPDPLLFFYYWYLNIQLGREVDEKMDLPIGQNLDEMPK